MYVAGLRGGHCSSFAIALSLGVVGALLYLAIIACMAGFLVLRDCACGVAGFGFPAGYSFEVARTAIRLTVFL